MLGGRRTNSNVRLVEKAERRQQIHLRCVVVGIGIRVSKACQTDGILRLQHIQKKARSELKVLAGLSMHPVQPSPASRLWR
jgi:hypothetical protein